MAIRWTTGIAVGVARIDEQHRELIDALSGLHEAMLHGEATQTLAGLVDFLRRYSVEHFGAEERAMAASGYPGLAAHQREHRRFVGDVQRFEKSLLLNGPTRALADELSGVLSVWFIGHIKSSDTALGRHLMVTGMQVDEIAVQPFARA